MFKFMTLMLVCVFVVGCSSSGDHREMVIEGAKTCNKICAENKNIEEYALKAGGGAPLFFMGGIEEKCRCNRPPN